MRNTKSRPLLRKLTDENDLTPIVFHCLRHFSASLKLQIGGGNIKVVQGDTGHAQARMVTDLYAHNHNEDRRHLAQKVEEDFFQKRQEAEKKIPRMKQRSPTSYCRKIPISPNFSLQPCRRKAPEICLLENCIIQQTPQKLKSLEPVEAQGFRWSCYPDLNWGPHPYQLIGSLPALEFQRFPALFAPKG